MDFKVLLTTFSAVLLAELADKTQLVGLGMASKTLKPLSVFLGSITAYVIITAVTVIIGATIGKHIRPEYVRYIGGSLFVLIGILFLTDKF